MSSTPYGSLDPARYQAHLRETVDGLTAALAGIDPGRPTPTCPRWTVAEVVAHLGNVHAWASRIVAEGADRPPKWQDLTVGAEPLGAWYAARAGGLLATLATTPATRPCWSHQPGRRVAAYWSRRQAHEAAMHRVDVTLAAGAVPVYGAELAADGIGEVFDVWLALLRRRAGIRPDLAAPVLFACTDRPERWLLWPGEDVRADGPVPDETGAAAAAVRGTAMHLLLALWKRGGTVEIDGDHALARRFLASTLTP